mmetsp:Transcript_31050/g.53070  ORF Transcript_31050/g.53070 Transcript_31050/m.53070 type:complete len:587 (+) Transcript_31050:306-2066(+)|eukprot:CAMPEP_0183726952 /NCGR_PEP_ID=MMETSP0737-20130205/24414_1 /TAXON_ID=385413 /ORGANISM="Thalassiosira miniscula, Strain CCMP1093" /LENGTH=586 /DNA_ID=CAMNT_0025958433 /DNA_START=258 /DNA_END=2018 /DNA_ORIENTATION=+
MAGSSRPGAAAAAAASSAKKTVEMITLPSGASYPTFLEPLTENETALLDMYEKIKHYEKEAARLKATEAKRRLEEADERYRAKVREREGADGSGSDDDNDAGEEKKKQSSNNNDLGISFDPHDDDDDDDDSDIDDEQDAEAIARRKKRAAEISKLRKDVNAARDAKEQKEAKREAAKEKEESMRRALLGEGGGGGATIAKKKRAGDDEDDEDSDEHDYSEDEDHYDATATGPSIKKKRLDHDNPWDEKPKPSLIANMGGDATPVHDFSKKLGMSKISLDGSVLFPTEGNLPWEPPMQPADFLDGCLELELPDFDPSAHASGGNNTVAIKFHSPSDSKRFSINIAAPNHDDYNDILFHFNPRHFKKGGQLVINDRKESMWGNDISVPLATLPLMFGVTACTLIVQINEEGFDVFVEGQHCARLEHRTPLSKKRGSLFLQFPSSDDYGNPENWMVYRVWWGRKAGMANDLNGVAGVQIYDSVHPKKLFISGLPKLRSDPEVDLRRAELERAFRKYGDKGVVHVSVQKNSTFAFVEVATERQADLALVEMANVYRINKARRTKHEALMEERAAREAKEKGVKKDTVDWD